MPLLDEPELDDELDELLLDDELDELSLLDELEEDEFDDVNGWTSGGEGEPSPASSRADRWSGVALI